MNVPARKQDTPGFNTAFGRVRRLQRTRRMRASQPAGTGPEGPKVAGITVSLPSLARRRG